MPNCQSRPAETTVKDEDSSDGDSNTNDTNNEDGVYVEEWVMGGVTRTVCVALRGNHIPHVASARRAAKRERSESKGDKSRKRSKHADLWLESIKT